MVDQVGWERCLFGSDFPFNGDRSVDQLAFQVDRLRINDTAKNGILQGNLRRLLRL